MSIIDSDYFINVVEFMPMDQLMQMRLVCRAIDNFIEIIAFQRYKNAYSPRLYILRMLGVNVDTNLTKREYIFDQNFNYYYWHSDTFDNYNLRIFSNEMILRLNDDPIYCIPFFKKIKARRDYNIYKVVKLILSDHNYYDYYLVTQLLDAYEKKDGNCIIESDLLDLSMHYDNADASQVSAIREAFHEHFRD